MNILFIRMSYIGDIMHATPAVKWIKTHYPHAKLHWIVTPTMTELIQNNPYVDEIIEWDRQAYEEYSKQLNIRTMWKLWWQLRNKLKPYHFDVAVDVQGRLITGLVLLASGAPIRLGMGHVKELNWLFTNYKTKGNEEHVIYKYLEVAKLLPKVLGNHSVNTDDHSFVIDTQGASTSKGDNLDDIHMVLKLGDGEENKAEQVLEGLPCPRIVLSPGTSWLSKAWGTEQWIQLIQQLQDQYTIVLVGSPHDGERFSSLISDVPNVINLMGQTTLGETAAILSRCHCIVGGDTGVLYMGNALDIPAVGLFGPTNPDEWGPVNNNAQIIQGEDIPCLGCRKRKCPEKEHYCMNAIQVDRVMQSIDTLLTVAQ